MISLLESYTFLLVLCALGLTGLAIAAWRSRARPGAMLLACLTAAMAAWSAAYALELHGTNLAAVLFWEKVRLTALTLTAVAWLAFVLAYTGRGWWLTWRRFGLLTVMPVVTLLLIWTNEAHGLFYTTVALLPRPDGFALQVTYGAWFWAHGIYAHSFILIGIMVLLAAFLRWPHPYHSQAGTMLAAALVPWLANLVDSIGLSSLGLVRLTPLAFIFSGAAVAWAVLRYRLLHVVPVARETVIENMSDAVLVLDGEGRVADINPAAERILGCRAVEAIGQPARQILFQWPDLIQRYRYVTDAHDEIVLTDAQGALRFYDLRISPLRGPEGSLDGRVIIGRDISERTQAEQELRLRNEELAALNAVAIAVAQSLDPQEVLDTALTQALAVLDAEGGLIYLYDESRQVCTQAAQRGISPDMRQELAEFALGQGIAGQAAQRGEPIIVPRLATDPRNLSPAAVREGWQSLVCVPLKARGKLVGAMTIESRAEGHFTNESLPLLMAIGHQIGTATENARLFNQTEQLKAFNETIVQGVAEAILIEDAQGLLTFANPAAEKLLGYTATELIGKSWTAIVPANHQMEKIQEETKKRPRGIATRYEAELLTKDSRTVPVIVNARPLFQDGKFTGVISAFSDITERVQSEEALARRAQELTALYQTALEITSQVDLSTLLHTIVERAARLLNTPSGGLYLCDPARQEVVCVVSYNTSRDYTGVVLKYGEGAAGVVAQTGKPLLVNNYRTWPGRAAVYDEDQPFMAVLSAPLIWQGQVTGVIHVLHGAEPRRFTQADVDLLAMFANQAAIAVAKARLLEAERGQRAQAEALRDTAAALASASSFEEVLSRIMEQASRVVPHDAATIMLIEQGMARVVRSRGFVERGLPDPSLGLSFPLTETENLRYIVETGQSYVISDTSRYTGWVNVPETSWIGSHIGVPIRRNNQVIGILNLDSAARGFLTEAHVEPLQAFADQIAVAVEKTQLFEATRRRAAELEALTNLTMELRTARTADVIVPIVLRQSIEVSGAAVGQVFRVEPASGDLLLWGWHPPDLPFSLGQKVRHRVGEGAAGHVAATGEIHIAKDITHDPLARILPEEADVIRQIHGGISLPLRTSEGQIVGVMQLGWVERRTYPPEEVRLLTSIAEVASNALHRAQLFETLEQRVAERTAELQAVNLRLADLERLKSQFLANASHELRTPLTNIKAYLDLLERGRVERQPHYLNVLKREADVLHQLVENLLDVAQLDYGRVQPKLAAVDLNQLLSVTLETCAILVSDRNLHLQTETGPGLLMVTADVKMLRQVITNLVSYVADQMPSGATVVLRTGQQSNETGHWATLGVYATGLTLRDLEQSRPADAGENRSFMPGGGLRLSICQEIVARLGGKIAGQAQEGQPGIVIRLPAGK